jgi:hypothetical protein
MYVSNVAISGDRNVMKKDAEKLVTHKYPTTEM